MATKKEVKKSSRRFTITLSDGTKKRVLIKEFIQFKHNQYLERQKIKIIENQEWARRELEYLILSPRLYEKLKMPFNLKVKLNETLTANCQVSLNYISLDKRIHLNDGSYICSEIPAMPIGNLFDGRIGEVSFHSNPLKQILGKNNKWKREGRQTIKPSKLAHYLTEVIGVKITDQGIASFNPDDPKQIKKIINRFVELLSSNLSTTMIDKIKVSDSPQEIYETNISNSNTGSLGGSCMRPDSDCSCKDYSDLYDTIGAKIAYVMNNNGYVQARALLWEGVKDLDGNVFNLMDRIYGNEEAIEAFKEWAKKNNYAYKVNQSAGSPTYSLNGKRYEGPIFYECNVVVEEDHRGAPYFDTFYYYYYGDFKKPRGFASQSHHDFGDYLAGLQCTSGELNVSTRVCKICDNRYHYSLVKDSPVEGYICTNCGGQDYTGIWYKKEDLVYSEFHNNLVYSLNAYKLSYEYEGFQIDDYIDKRSSHHTVILENDMRVFIKHAVQCALTCLYCFKSEAIYNKELGVYFKDEKAQQKFIEKNNIKEELNSKRDHLKTIQNIKYTVKNKGGV